MINVLKWFKVNSMKANPKKFQFKILGKSTRQTIILNINNIKIREFQNVELLSSTIDNQLTFKDHINILYCRANYKLHALRRIRKYLILEKSKLLHNAFIKNQFELFVFKLPCGVSKGFMKTFKIFIKPFGTPQ